MMMMMTYISFPVMMISLLCKRDRVGIFYLFQSKMTFVQPNFNRPKIPTQFLLDVSPLHLNLWQIWNASKTFARNVDAVLSRLIRIAFQAEGKPDPEILWFKHDAPVTQSSSVKVFQTFQRQRCSSYSVQLGQGIEQLFFSTFQRHTKTKTMTLQLSSPAW